MAECPNGHVNPAHWELCGECGAPIADQTQEAADQARRRRRAVGVIGVVVLIGAAFAAGAFMFRQGPQQTGKTDTAIRRWWTGSHDTVAGLRNAIDDSRQAVERLDTAALPPACHQMHDLAGVRLPALLPSPDPALTGELQAAAGDAHDAAHMCLAAIAGSSNNYRGEFAADLDQAEDNLAAAQAIIDKTVTSGVYTC